jgi:hypothetical protein
MFILTLKDKPEGVFSVIDDTNGEQIIPIFECEDDAERYQEQLQFQTQTNQLQFKFIQTLLQTQFLFH